MRPLRAATASGACQSREEFTALADHRTLSAVRRGLSDIRATAAAAHRSKRSAEEETPARGRGSRYGLTERIKILDRGVLAPPLCAVESNERISIGG